MDQINKPKESAWQNCHYCSLEHFKSAQEFTRHLRERHCTNEGGSYVCRYGYNGVCNSLPLDGVSDRDYESHVQRHHTSKMSQSSRDQDKWTVYSAAQNLPAVLNDPNKSKQYNFFTKTWGDSFTEFSTIKNSYYLPEINHSHFELYLRKISKKYRKHYRLATIQQQNNFELTQAVQRPSNQLQFKENDINNIPEIFFKPTLPLNDAGTFNAVFPCVGNETNISSPDQQSGRLLQEKLSHYLDIVEVKIAEQVSQKSSAFFHAMTSHDTIMEQMSNATVEVKNLRYKVQQLDTNLAKKPLKILSLARSRNNDANLLSKLRLMATVLQTQPTLQLLLSAPDYVAALELISGTQDVLAKELAGVTSLRHLPSQLDEMSKLIDKMLNTEFERYAAADLHRPFTEDIKVLDPDRLTSLVAGLLRLVNLHFLEVYKHEAVTAAQAILKQLLIENLADNEGADSDLCLTGSAETTPTMAPTQWLKLTFQATDVFTKLIRRVKAVHDVIERTANVCAGRINKNLDESDCFLSLEHYSRVEVKLHNLLTSICDYCHDRCATLISSQTDKNSAITAAQIISFAENVENFTKLCEEVCGRSSPALKVAFKSQAGRYVHKFHTQRKSKLELLLDSERWKCAEVPPEFHVLLEQLKTRNFTNESPTSNKEMIVTNGATSSLLVGNETYVVIGTVLMLLRFICEYCTCAQQVPSMGVQIGKNLADLLQSFNSRTCQLILGAGALQKAGLKTITSVNLALASRALQLVLWFLPYVKEHFSQLKCEVKKLGFDVVEGNIKDHIVQLREKILSIMSNLVSNLLSEWNARPPIPSQSFRNISKQFVKLHEAVGDILPADQVTTIYSTVHITFKECLRDQIRKMNIVNNGGPQHGVVTSELTFYLETLRTLKVIPDIELSDKAMDDIWDKSRN